MRTLVIGGAGYIGSRLCNYLKAKGIAVSSLDVAEGEWQRNYATLTRADLSSIAAVVLLAGNSSVKACKDAHQALLNNVAAFVNLMEIIGDRRLIYASSASVYGCTGTIPQTEDAPFHRPLTYYDLQKHEIEQYASLFRKDAYGLRFGTVNGVSPNPRFDLVINAMCQAARRDGLVTAVNPQVNRAILGLGDLCMAVESILGTLGSNAGIYNLSSFNATIAEIASAVARRTGARVEMVEAPIVYDVRMSTEKFSDTFSFTFRDSLRGLVEELCHG